MYGFFSSIRKLDFKLKTMYTIDDEPKLLVLPKMHKNGIRLLEYYLSF